MSEKIEEYTSDIMDKVFNETSGDESDKIRNRMLLAAKIEDGMKAAGIKKSFLAEKLKKQPSVITKWLSGTHNFTAETLWDIEKVLDIKLIDIEKAREEQVFIYHMHISVEDQGEPQCYRDLDLFNDSRQLSPFKFSKSFNKNKTKEYVQPYKA